MKEENNCFWCPVILIALLTLFSAVGVLGQNDSTKLELAGVELGSKFTQTRQRGEVAGIEGLVLCSMDKDSLINTIIFLPANEKEKRSINSVEYNRVLYALGNSLDLWDAEVRNGNRVLTVIFNKLSYEVILKVYNMQDGVYLIVTLNKL